MVLSTLLAFLLLSDRPLDFRAVTEAEHNPLFGINGQGVDHGVPQAVIEAGHRIPCPAQLFQINLDAFPLCSQLGKVLLQGIVLGLVPWFASFILHFGFLPSFFSDRHSHLRCPAFGA